MEDNFEKIIYIKNEIMCNNQIIQDKLSKLKQIYNDLILKNNKKMFLFCLDSFYFQYKILNIEMDNINILTTLIMNRIYGDYYKLYNVIIHQLENAPLFKDISNNIANHTVYKELEPFREYNIDATPIHDDILSLINQMKMRIETKEQEYDTYNESLTGLSVSNFLNTLDYENTLVREQLGLYTNYVHFYHQSQIHFLTQLRLKIKYFHENVDNILNNYGTPSHYLVFESGIFCDDERLLHPVDSVFFTLDETI